MSFFPSMRVENTCASVRMEYFLILSSQTTLVSGYLSLRAAMVSLLNRQEHISTDLRLGKRLMARSRSERSVSLSALRSRTSVSVSNGTSYTLVEQRSMTCGKALIASRMDLRRGETLMPETLTSFRLGRYFKKVKSTISVFSSKDSDSTVLAQ